jgi:hypothetical protein
MDNEEKYFIPENKEDGEKEYLSDDGLYKLNISWYRIGKPEDHYWNYSRGIVTEIKTEKIIADIKRNYSGFWHRFLTHPNGNKYLLCGQDYQGYTVINCTTGERHDYLPSEAKKGLGFCWIEVEPLEGGKKIEVYGCYWGAPFEYVTYDFSNPDILPYLELGRRYDTDTTGYEEYEEEDEKDGNTI